MADNIWDASTDSDANTPANWSLGTVPAGTDVMVFQASSTNAACNLSGNISCAGFRFVNADEYTGAISLVTHTLTLGTTGFDCVDGGSATFTIGGGTIDTSGIFSAIGIGTWTNATSGSEVILSGTTQFFRVTTGHRTAYTVTVDGSYTSDTGAVLRINNVTVNGTLTQAINNTYRSISGAITVTNFGTIDGIGQISLTSGGTLVNNGTFSLATCQLWEDCTISGTGVFSVTSTMQFRNDVTAKKLTIASNLVFDCDVIFQCDAGETYEVDNSGNYNLEFSGNVTFTDTTLGMTWTGGAGTLTLAGSNNQDITTPVAWAEVLEDTIIDKTVGVLKLAGPLNTNTLTGTSGDLDLNGNTWTSSGSVDLDTVGGFNFHNGIDPGQNNGNITVQSGTLALDGTGTEDLEIDDLDFTMAAGVTGLATFCAVINSQATGDADIDATDGSSLDNGSNTGWNFVGGGPPPIDVAVGQVEVAGIDPTVIAATTVDVALGQVEVAGIDPAVSTQTIVDVAIGQVEVAGINAGVASELTVEVQIGQVEVAGGNVDSSAQTIVDVAVGQVEVAGINATSSAQTIIEVTAGQVEVAGINFTIPASQTVDVEIGQVEVTGYNGSIISTTTVDVAVGQVEVAGIRPEIQLEVVTNVSLGQVEVAGINPAVSAQVIIDCAIGQVEVAGIDPAIDHPTVITATLGQVEIAGLRPGVSRTIAVTLGQVEVAGLHGVIFVGRLGNLLGPELGVIETGPELGVINSKGVGVIP